MEKVFVFKMMCDRCYKIMENNEPLHGIDMEDESGEIREFRGHYECVEEIRDMILSEAIRRLKSG